MWDWRFEVQLPPNENCTSYCRKCNSFTYWKPVTGSPIHKTLECQKCGRLVEVDKTS